eukprot:187175_1
MSFCFLWTILIICNTAVLQQQKQIINIYSITTSFSVGESLRRGHEIAIDKINDDLDILQQYHLNFSVLTSEDDSTMALLHALEISSKDNDDNTSYTIPIVLGCDWSSLSTVTAPTLSVFHYAQISSSSTAAMLSATYTFSHFYRTITSDSLQAESIIYLCKIFNWTQIGIMHVNDNYGVYLAVSISELATSNSIEVNSIAFERNKNTSYRNAVVSMKEIGVYIILIVSHGDGDIKQMFKALTQENMVQYPYFYIASDGWFDPKVLHNITDNFANFQGIIGCLPWQPMTLNKTYYKQHNLSLLHEKANRLYNEIEEWYYVKYGNNSETDVETIWTPMGSRLIYAYDSIMLYASVLQKLHDKLGGFQMLFHEDNEPEDIINMISEIILNEIEFESVTGLVTFNSESGDREHGLNSFGYITQYGDIEYFGYSFFQTINDSNGSIIQEFKAVINKDLIIWPDKFTSRNVVPQSNTATEYELSLISEELFIMMTVIASIGIVSMLAYVCYILWIYYFIDPSQTLDKLNMVIYSGVIMAYVNIIVSGLDERIYDPKNENDRDILNVLCNIRVWFVVISFTLSFTPMFSKTYKLTRIFTELLITKTIPDGRMLGRVFIALSIDLILLIIFISLSPFERVWREGDRIQIDELRWKQYMYGTCSIQNNDSVQYAFWVCVGGWKLIELIFGIYVSIIVSRMSFKSQMWTMCIIVGIVCVDIVLISFGPTDVPDFMYLVTCIDTLLIMNVIVFERYLMKLRIKCDMKTNENTKYTKEDLELSDERRMQKLLKLRLEEIAKAENWAREMSGTITNTDNSLKYTSDVVQDS